MATVIYPDVVGASALPTPMGIQVLSGDTPVSYGGQDLRWLVGAMYNRYGRIGFGDSLWLYPTSPAGWSVDVNAGMAIVGANASTSYTPERYLVTIPSRVTIPLSTFNTAPTGTRNHGIWIVVNDASQTGAGGGYRATIVATEDTGSGAPNPVATGSLFVRIGTVTIAPSQSNIGSANISTIMQRSSRGTLIQEVTYKSGFTGGQTSGTGQGLSYSVEGNTVRWQGSVCRTSGNFTASTVYDVASPPSSLWPKYLRTGLAVGAGPTVARIVVPTSGGLQLTPFSFNPGDMAYISLDGFSYEIF